MSLRITDFDGVNLIDQPPEQVSVAAVPILGGRADIQCFVVEEGTLPYSFISGILSWDDGSALLTYNGTGTLTIDTYKSLQPGNYVVKVEAHNYGVPTRETVSVNFPYEVRPVNAVPETLPIIYGPILPKDTGFPNPIQWNWNRGEDEEILASSVKMLLTTTKGERVMQPEYGTNLRFILFEFQNAGVESMVQQEILDALTRWEPRVRLQFLTVEQTGAREITVNATFASKLNQKDIFVPMVFSS